jgi:two-component sensor histidine kinase/CHASE1-domain containing sensor protein
MSSREPPATSDQGTAVRQRGAVAWHHAPREGARVNPDRGLTRFAGLHAGRASWVVLAASVLITAAAWYVSARSVDARVHGQFVARAEQIELAIHDRMGRNETVLRSGVGLFRGSQGVSREEWRSFVAALELQRRFPGIQGLGYALRLAPGEVAAHEAAVRAEGFPDYTVHPVTPARDEYSSIVYLEPFDERNQRAFGFDMTTEPLRREAMAAARDTGEPALSGRVTLVQETTTDIQHGFLMYAPYYDPALRTGSVEERRLALRGFVYSPFRVRDLMRGILGGIDDIHYQIFDGDRVDPAALLIDGAWAFARPAPPPGELERVSVIEIGGRRWTLRYRPGPGFRSDAGAAQPTMIAVGGLLIDLLLFGVIAALSLTRRRAEALAAQMTVDLRGATDELERSNRDLVALLREVHHRVKNNLQVIASLLVMQGQASSDERVRRAFELTRDRVHAMALVHDRMHKAEGIAEGTVDLARYAEDLVQHLFARVGKDRMEVVVDTRPVRVSLDRAVPAGLLLNELLTNVIQHAFPPPRRGRVTVRVGPVDDGIELAVVDDGVGLPPGVDVATATTLGLEIVQALVGQLGAALTVGRDGGTAITLHFPAA